jgi:signal transduction histidine kinase/DNA-binding response OmpR family regulator
MWELIRNKSGLKLKIIRSENWAQTLNLIREGEVIVIDCISRTDERSGYMDFSDVIFTSNLVMIGQDDLDYINGLSDTGDLSVAVQEGTSEIELIKRDYPGLKLIFYSDADIAYRDVSAGKIDLFLRHQADFTFRKKESVLSNLKIAGPTEYKREYRIGVAKGNCTLLSILNKSLSSITPQEKNIIFEKWIGSEKFVINYDLVWKTGIISLLIILTIIYWNRRLAREIELKEMAQAALEAAMEKVELATRAKSEFLANMSHEIRTPMNAIIGFSELLKKTPLTSSQETYLNTIKSGGETLLNIINDILDLSKIEANKMEVNYSYFDLHSLVFELKQFFGEKLSSKNLEFLIENDPCLPRIILLDELRVRQIFFNLLSNALKFTDRGHIKVISSFVQKEGIKIDLKITVEDTGSGIRKEDHEKIFGAFEQAGTTEISKKFQGTGLGLAITKKLTELMNGRISVESEPGAGSKFIVEFFDVATDRNTLAGSDKSVIGGGSIKFRNAKILIADDIESNRLLLTEICRNFGFEILEAENGLQALESAKLNVPDLILMDVRMPEMDGYEAVGKIKSDPKLKQIPVIAVTASVMSSDRAKIEKHNFDGHIRKPVILQELVENLKKYIPYEISGNKREVIDEGDEIILEKDELIHELDTNVGVQISLAKENHNFAQIRELSEQLKTLAVRHNSAVLKNYARMLFESVMRYDVEDIRILLNNYNDIAEHIKRNNGGSNGGQEL